MIRYHRQPVPVIYETSGISSLQRYKRLITDRLLQILAAQDLDPEQTHDKRQNQYSQDPHHSLQISSHLLHKKLLCMYFFHTEESYAHSVS